MVSFGEISFLVHVHFLLTDCTESDTQKEKCVKEISGKDAWLDWDQRKEKKFPDDEISSNRSIFLIQSNQDDIDVRFKRNLTDTSFKDGRKASTVFSTDKFSPLTPRTADVRYF